MKNINHIVAILNSNVTYSYSRLTLTIEKRTIYIQNGVKYTITAHLCKSTPLIWRVIWIDANGTCTYICPSIMGSINV